jgi:hypothetical protein
MRQSVAILKKIPALSLHISVFSGKEALLAGKIFEEESGVNCTTLGNFTTKT